MQLLTIYLEARPFKTQSFNFFNSQYMFSNKVHQKMSTLITDPEASSTTTMKNYEGQIYANKFISEIGKTSFYSMGLNS